MRNDMTDITVVLDRSGSMSTVKNDTEGGFNQFVKEQTKGAGEAVLTLVQFDTDYEFVHKNKPIKDIPPLDLQPRGGTALLDAIGRSITETGERLKAMNENERPGKVVFVILTDGEENSSKEFKKTQISEMIKKQTEIYKWQFVFLGANQDAIKEANDIGILASNAMNYAATAKGVNVAFSATASNLNAYRVSGNIGAMRYSDTDRKNALDEKEPK